MKIIVLFLGAIFIQLAYAGNGSGTIQQIIAHTSGGNGAGVVMFKTMSNTNKAACSTTDGGTQWAFSLEKEHGRAMYSLLLSAQAQQIPI